MISITASKRSSTLSSVASKRPDAVAVGRGKELVVEAELVEEGAQPRIVVGGEARMGAERVGHLGERLAEMLRHHLLVRHVVRHLAQPVHVVGERDQPGLDLVVGEHAEGVAHHAGARDLAEGADMRQPRGAVAGLEDDLVLRLALEPRDDLPRLLERPGVRLLGELARDSDLPTSVSLGADWAGTLGTARQTVNRSLDISLSSEEASDGRAKHTEYRRDLDRRPIDKR